MYEVKKGIEHSVMLSQKKFSGVRENDEEKRTTHGGKITAF